MTHLSEKLASKNKLCTGCSACMNICPEGAITMQADAEGFVYPAIADDKCSHCGLCEKGCPVLHPKYLNIKQPDCYAMMAQDDERLTSSSGGFVSVAARWVLRKGGSVYGAAWGENWNVHHIEIENEGALCKIKGSKYLQSDV